MADKPTTELIKLDGTIIKSDGSQQKSNFFKFLELRDDDYSDIAYTPEEAKRIRSHMCGLSTGASAAIPLICSGPAKCPFASRCIFVKIDKENLAKNPNAKRITAIGRACLVETNLLDEWTRLYIQEYEVDPESFTEFTMVRELAETELMLWRLNNNLAKPENAELVQETVVGVDKQGNTLTRKEISSFLEAKERLQNKKQRIIRLMVGDREGKWKRDAALKKTAEDDISVSSAKLRSQMERLLTQTKIIDVKLKEAEGKVIDATIEEEEVETHQPLTPEDLINGD